MRMFSQRVEIPVGQKLGGYSDRLHARTNFAAKLEIHGVAGGYGDRAWEICAVDALYAGVLVDLGTEDARRRVICASHTHFAPMLDACKPDIGEYSEVAATRFGAAILHAAREEVQPDVCTVYRTEVSLPVYRRFDFPGGVLNSVLTRKAGFFPNERHPVDRSVTLFVFSRAGKAVFAFAHHACHPVTRANPNEASADYVQALRDAVANRFGVSTCLFFLGCAADIRPNLARKRVPWMPRSRLNWRFKYPPSYADEARIDAEFAAAVESAQVTMDIAIDAESIRCDFRDVLVHGLGVISVPQLRIRDELNFSFLPFEVSHRYHLDALVSGGLPRTFIVSCAGANRGYLPHPSQLEHGGYEVDGSRTSMELPQRVFMNGSDLW